MRAECIIIGRGGDAGELRAMYDDRFIVWIRSQLPPATVSRSTMQRSLKLAAAAQ